MERLERKGVKSHSLFKPNLKITVSPAVALLNYMKSGTCNFSGFPLNLDFTVFSL
jgi:hypothetical protein